jgi:hypothetical protein
MIVPENRWGQGLGGTDNRAVDTEAFVRDGYVAVRGAFDEGTARACREMIWAVLAEVPGGFTLDGSDPSPVARAIVRGLAAAH